MASKGPPKKPTDAPARRRRPPPTIDLPASEVGVDPAPESTPPSEPEISASPASAVMSDVPPPDASSADSAADQTQAVPQVTLPPQALASGGKGGERREPGGGPSEESGIEDSSAALPPEPPRVPPSPWPMLGAAVGGGAIVLVALAILWFAGLIPTNGGDTAQLSAQLSTRLAALEAQAVRPEQPAVDPKALDDMAARIAKIESAASAPRPAATDPAVIGRLGSIEVAVKSLGDATANLNSRSEEVSAALREARERADTTAKALAELQSAVGRQRASAADKSEVEGLAGRLAALESSTRSVEQKIETPGSTAADRDVRLAVLTSALKDAVERGAPYAAELAALKPLVADQQPIAALEKFASAGAPTAQALAAELTALVPALAQAAAPQARDGGFLDRLQANANRLVRVRPINEPVGDDPAAIVERIDGKARRADIDGALTELARLTPSQRAPAEAWIARAQARNAALTAAREVAAKSYGALARPAH